METDEIESQRVAGEITLALKYGSPKERESLLRVIEQLSGPQERQRLETWVSEGMPES